MDWNHKSEAKVLGDHNEMTGDNTGSKVKVSIGTITDIKGLASTHIPELSKRHPLLLKRYVMPWKEDMVNSKLIRKHADLMGLCKRPREDSLFLENKERLCHGEERQSIRDKAELPSGPEITDLPLHSPHSRYHKYGVRHKMDTTTTM
ncbi:sperm-associated microtubule inner protein 10 [Discoglossus pictus]